jgi:hypothetical protein
MIIENPHKQSLLEVTSINWVPPFTRDIPDYEIYLPHPSLPQALHINNTGAISGGPLLGTLGVETKLMKEINLNFIHVHKKIKIF